jgi:antitoxin HicB
MRRYTVLLLPESEESGYSVIRPSLPGWVTQGETVDEALANAREAVAGHVASLAELGAEVPEEDIPPAIVSLEIETGKQALA